MEISWNFVSPKKWDPWNLVVLNVTFLCRMEHVNTMSHCSLPVHVGIAVTTFSDKCKKDLTVKK